MEYRSLGNTGIEVSSLGLGVEHLKRESPENITQVIKKAITSGINYFDLVWSLPNVIEGVSEAIIKSDIHLAVHLGSSYRNGKYVKAKSVKKCEETFRETLDRLNKDSVSIINLHYIKGMKEWNNATKKKGILDLAARLREEGLGRIIAVSTHDLEVVKKVANHSEIASVMYQVNIVNHLFPGRDEALAICKSHGKGLVAMKPFAAGNLLKTGKRVKFPEFKTGGFKTEFRIPSSLNDLKCLHYSLCQIGVSCVVFGVKNIHELERNLEYFSINKEDRKYTEELSLIY